MHLSGAADEAARLKRLALLFDEIDFVRPTSAVVKKEASERVRKALAGGDPPSPIELNGFRDFHHAFEILSLGEELEETIAGLEEAGIAIDRGRLVTEAEESDSYRRWRDPMITRAVRDPDWNRLTETPEDAYAKPEIAEVKIRFDSGEEETFLWYREPPAIWCADDIAIASYLARKLDAYPVFAEEFQPLLDFKYEQYKQGAEKLRQQGHLWPVDHRARFGEAAFAIANSVFSSQSVEEQSIEQILEYRAEMEIARRQFLSSDLVELQSLIAENPWGADSEAEVAKYVRGKLAGDLASFESESVSTWEKLYGALAVRAGSVVQSGAIGGGVGGVAAYVLPSTSFWLTLVGGLAVGFGKEVPKVIEDLARALNEERERNRSGIAYVAKFNSRPDASRSSFFGRSR